MITFIGVFKYTALRFLNSPTLLLVFLVGIIILSITTIWSGEIDFKNAYIYFHLFNFFLALVLGSGIIGGETSHGHIALIFTKPVKRGTFFLYKYLSVLICAFLLLIISIILSGLLLVVIYKFIHYSSFPLPMFLKVFLYMFLNQITILALLFFLSSFTKDYQNSFLVFAGVFGLLLIFNFIAVRYPSLANFLKILQEILLPFKVEVFRGNGFSLLKFLFHWIIYPALLLMGALLIVNKKEISK